jgi:hypothetical protein
MQAGFAAGQLRSERGCRVVVPVLEVVEVSVGDEPFVELLLYVELPLFIEPEPVDGVVVVLLVAPGFVEPVPPIDVPVAEVPLEPVLPLLPLWASATLPAMPRMHRAAAARVDFVLMWVSF